MNQLQELLSASQHTDKHSSADIPTPASSLATTLLDSAHHQLLVGCFGFGLLDGMDGVNGGQLCHYQVTLQAAIDGLYFFHLCCATIYDGEIKLYVFLPAQRYAGTGTSYGPVSVCICVCLSQVRVLQKWLNKAGF